MTKTEAKKQIEILQAELDKLKEIVEAPEKPASLLTKPMDGSRSYTSCVYQPYGEGGFTVRTVYAKKHTPYAYKHGNFFQTRELAAAYADAFDTLLLLRHCEGSEPAKDGGNIQYLIGYRGDNVYPLCAALLKKDQKLDNISPMFATKRQAQAAIESVGEERIIRMFKTFHHIA